MRVLVVKLSSMGDLIQALPALTDAARALPGLSFDWVVDESFAEIPTWHPAVGGVITTAHRRWRGRPWRAWRSGELGRFLGRLRAHEYDRVIDAQTNLKSAVVTRLARGPRAGPDAASVREWGAHWAYQQRVAVPKAELAIERWRQLFAQLLDYPQPASPADFGLAAGRWLAPPVRELPDHPYLVAVTNASWSNKCWPEAHWGQLLDRAGAEGYGVVLPWGTAAERERAQRIAGDRPHCQVLPRLSLTELGGVLSASAGAVCNDTGLAHVAAAIGVPTVTVYGPTDPGLIGAMGPASARLEAVGYACVPCYRRDCRVAGYQGPDGQCLATLAAERVWQSLRGLQHRSPIASDT